MPQSDKRAEPIGGEVEKLFDGLAPKMKHLLSKTLNLYIAQEPQDLTGKKHKEEVRKAIEESVQ